MVGQCLSSPLLCLVLVLCLWQGTKLKLVVNMIMGSMMSSFAEGLALAQGAELPVDALLQVSAGDALCGLWVFVGAGGLSGDSAICGRVVCNMAAVSTCTMEPC